MLELKNVSKFYYRKGVVSSGFTKISLKFNMGEFVAITGESGSGKSTLLNVISGLDTYEEGEMYIFGKETSHYTEKDYEIYRRKYIGNIFQSFNLVNSYTVYQNIELVLLLNGFKKKDIKNKVLDVIKQVDLYKYRNKKVSKLSGGQKQRVAIARALITDAPIILADEPTGNLDKKSSESVLELLHEISKNKLVIVVTHNYDQISEYVTRKITMHDGRILEDKQIRDYNEPDKIEEVKYSPTKWYNKIRLGIRNAFNILSKFLLTIIVYLFIVFALFFAYSSFTSDEYDTGLSGYNMFFNKNDDKRIVIKKNDRTPFNEEEYNQMLSIPNVSKIVKNDILIDQDMSFSDEAGKYFLYGNVYNFNDITSVDEGKMPTNDYEMVVTVNEYNYFDSSELLNQRMEITELFDNINSEKYYVTIVGTINSDSYQPTMYVSDKVLEDIGEYINKTNTTIRYKFYDIDQQSYLNSTYGEIIPSSKVSKGKVIIPEDWIYKCKNMKCKNKNFTISTDNIYFNDTLSLKVLNHYTKKTLAKLTGYKYDKYNGAIFINKEDYNELYDKGIFQSSVFVENPKEVRQTITALENMNIKTLYIPDVYENLGNEFRILRIVKVIFIGCLIIGLFFISYFVIKLILKSRNIYYSTLRILGAEAKTTNQLLVIELITLSHIAYLLFIVFIILCKKSIINVENLNELISFVTTRDYVIMYITLMIMTLLIAARYCRKIFKGSAMNSYKEEV